MTTPFGMPTFVKVGKKKTPKRLGAPGTPHPPTESGNPPSPLTNWRETTYEENLPNTDTFDWLLPSSLIAGDGILVFVNLEGGQISTVPSGYTLLESVTPVGGGHWVYWKISDGTETDATFTADTSGTTMAFISGRVPANGVTLSTPEVEVVESLTIDPPSITPAAAPNTYHMIVALLTNKGGPDIDAPSGYTREAEAVSEEVQDPRAFVAQKASTSVTTTEDPGEWTYSGSSGSRFYRAYTIAVLAEGGDPDVAPFDHTHVEADVTDLDHWTETDHDALDHTGLTGVGGSGAVNDLDDATITGTPADNEVLAYDSGTSEWINQTAAEAGLATDSHAATHADGGADELDVSDLASGAATDGWVPTADGAGGVAWEAVPAGGSVGLDDLTDVTITTPSDGQHLEYDSGTSEWVNATPAAGGGGSVPQWIEDLATNPSSAHTDDDEFNDASLAVAWTQVTPTGSATFTEDNDVLSVKFSGQTANDCVALLRSMTTTTAPVTVEVAITPLWYGNLLMLGPIFTDGTDATSNCVWLMPHLTSDIFRLSLRSGTLTALSNGVVSGFTQRDFAFLPPRLLMRLVYHGTNAWDTAYSIDGVSWSRLHTATAAQSATLTPTHYGVGVSDWGQAGADKLATFEYFRVTETDGGVD